MPSNAGPDAGSVAADEPLVQAWYRFLHDHMKDRVYEALARASADAPAHSSEPFSRSLIVSLWDIQAFDEKLFDHLLAHPYESVAYVQEALRLFDPPTVNVATYHEGTSPVEGRRDVVTPAPRPNVNFRVGTRAREGKRIPHASAEERIPPDSSSLGRLITIRGVVKQVDAKRPKLQDSVWACGRCGASIRVPQDEHLELRAPLECFEDQGGCGRESSFKLVVGEHRGKSSQFISAQRVVLEQSVDELEEGMSPARIEVWLEDDAVESMRPGQRAFVTGIFRSAMNYKGNRKSTIMNIFVDASSVEPEEDEDASLEMTPEQRTLLEQLDAQGDLLVTLTPHLAPHIHGNELCKQVMLLSLIRGVDAGGRSQPHGALVGDPGTGKTQLARWMAKLARRVVHVTGANATIPGLTIAADKDGDEARSLQPGAFPLASGGLLLCDEMQEAEEEVLKALHEPMEEQTVSKTAAAISAHVKTNTIVWIVANPEDGRWNPFGEHKLLQCGIPPALMSRLDWLFLFEDKPDADRDREVALAMMRRRYARINPGKKGPETPQPTDGAMGAPVTQEFLRKLVALCQSHVPTVSQEVEAYLAERAVSLRVVQHVPRDGKDVPILHITQRQVESIARFAEAICKLHRRDRLTIEDVDAAEGIVTTWIRAALGQESNLDLLTRGSTGERSLLRKRMLDAIRDLESLNDRGAARADVYARFPEEAENDLDLAWKQLLRSRKIFNPHDDFARHL